MSSLKRHEGYLLIDHRASPGIPADLSRKIGLDPRFTGEGHMLEQATLTCSHCKTAYVKNPFRVRERAYCRSCDHYICDGCDAARSAPLYTHATFEKKLHEAYEAAVQKEQSTAGSTPPVLLLSTS